jgi:hypothetical protein
MSLREIFERIKFESKKLSEDAQPYPDLIAFRVMIARLGDSDNNRWWNIAILSSFGKQHLADFLPKTIQSKRIWLAFAACAKVEGKTIPSRNYISLFNLGFNIEREISLLLSRNSMDESNIERILSIIESTKWLLDSPGWMQQLGYEAPGGSNITASESNITALCLGTLDKQPGKEFLVKIQESLFAGYGNSFLGHLVVPYYEVKSLE